MSCKFKLPLQLLIGVITLVFLSFSLTSYASAAPCDGTCGCACTANNGCNGDTPTNDCYNNGLSTDTGGTCLGIDHPPACATPPADYPECGGCNGNASHTYTVHVTGGGCSGGSCQTLNYTCADLGALCGQCGNPACTTPTSPPSNPTPTSPPSNPTPTSPPSNTPTGSISVTNTSGQDITTTDLSGHKSATCTITSTSGGTCSININWSSSNVNTAGFAVRNIGTWHSNYGLRLSNNGSCTSVVLNTKWSTFSSTREGCASFCFLANVDGCEWQTPPDPLPNPPPNNCYAETIDNLCSLHNYTNCGVCYVGANSWSGAAATGNSWTMTGATVYSVGQWGIFSTGINSPSGGSLANSITTTPVSFQLYNEGPNNNPDQRLDYVTVTGTCTPQDGTCNTWGSWSCSDSTHKTRSRTTATAPFCGGSACSPLSETVACSTGQTCVSGSCMDPPSLGILNTSNDGGGTAGTDNYTSGLLSTEGGSNWRNTLGIKLNVTKQTNNIDTFLATFYTNADGTPPTTAASSYTDIYGTRLNYGQNSQNGFLLAYFTNSSGNAIDATATCTSPDGCFIKQHFYVYGNCKNPGCTIAGGTATYGWVDLGTVSLPYSRKIYDSSGNLVFTVAQVRAPAQGVSLTCATNDSTNPCWVKWQVKFHTALGTKTFKTGGIVWDTAGLYNQNFNITETPE